MVDGILDVLTVFDGGQNGYAWLAEPHRGKQIDRVLNDVVLGV